MGTTLDLGDIPEHQIFHHLGRMIMVGMLSAGEEEENVNMFLDSLARGSADDIIIALRRWRPDVDIINIPEWLNDPGTLLMP